ncbi:AFG1-like ATPase [Oryza brachyantha]|nr:AFG1-like ATPase [Oryza brachyantha]
MRAVVRSLRQLRRFAQLHADGHLSMNRLIKQQNALMLCSSASCSMSTVCYNREIDRYVSPSVELLRSKFSTVAADSIKDVARGGPMVEYERRIASGELVDGDNFQIDTIQQLQRLYEELVENEEACQLDRYQSSEKSGRSRWLWSRLITQPSTYSPVKGLYMYGGVGTGKTMLMDLFYEQLPANWRKKRIHFHDFMLNVHSRLQMHKGVSDPLEVVAAEISDEAIILCLDEFMVTDVADAMILNRLFRHLFSKGVILVSTSNRAPDQLYEGGLQRDLFLPFIDTLKDRCIAHPIGSAVDYRQLGSAEQGFYFVGKEYNTLLKQKFQTLIGNEKPRPQTVEVVMGRQLQVPLGANGCAYFPFEDLCDRPLGAADYFGLFKKFHTLALDGIPKFGSQNRTAAYRFITLVDVMYENKARLLCTAEAASIELFENVVTVAEAHKISPRSSRSQKTDDPDLCVDNELGFAKDRTISRLTEINSREYLEDFEARLRQQPLQGVDNGIDIVLA